MQKISIIIPAKNEARRIGTTIMRMISVVKQTALDYEIIIIDDGSTDGTRQTVKNMHLDKVFVFKLNTSRGKGHALKLGHMVSDGDYVLFSDADLQVPAETMIPFLNLIEIYCADAVIGNKRHKWSNVDYPLIRKIVSYGYKTLVKILFQLPLNDTQVGFKLYRWDALNAIADKLCVDKFAIDIEILSALRDNGFIIIDAPVRLTPPDGSGSVNIRSIIDTFTDTIAVLRRRNKGWYKPTKGVSHDGRIYAITEQRSIAGTSIDR